MFASRSTRRPNKIQANPNKSKQNCLDLLGFIRPNRDFSMSYDESKQKNPVPSRALCKTSQARIPHYFSPPHAPPRALILELEMV
jgi:hypothetical protein